jgi:2-methylcitrate dehydratase
MGKIRVRVEDEIEALYPQTIVTRVEATTVSGQRHRVEIRNPKGHELNPMTDADISDKFLRAAEPVLGAARAKTALDCWWNLPSVSNLSEAFDLLDLPVAARA